MQLNTETSAERIIRSTFPSQISDVLVTLEDIVLVFRSVCRNRGAGFFAGVNVSVLNLTERLEFVLETLLFFFDIFNFFLLHFIYICSAAVAIVMMLFSCPYAFVH